MENLKLLFKRKHS